MVNAPETRAALDKQGVVVETSTPEELAALIRNDVDALGRDHPRGGDRRQVTSAGS